MSTISISLSKTGKHAGKYFAIVDEVDADLNDWSWQVRITKKTAYASHHYNSYGIVRTVQLHRIILSRMLERELTSGEQVDHINHNGLDNRRENLRLATIQQNGANRQLNSNNKTGYKGVHQSGERFTAGITIKKQYTHLGTFDTPEEAHEAYIIEAKKRFGDFSNQY